MLCFLKEACCDILPTFHECVCIDGEASSSIYLWISWLILYLIMISMYVDDINGGKGYA